MEKGAVTSPPPPLIPLLVCCPKVNLGNIKQRMYTGSTIRLYHLGTQSDIYSKEEVPLLKNPRRLPGSRPRLDKLPVTTLHAE